MLASSSFSFIIRQLEQLKQFESCICAFDAEIACLTDNFDTKLETITGVGKTLAAVIFSEIGGDIKKFSSVPKLVVYARIYPKSRQSGKSKTEEHLSKRGSPYLSRDVWIAATVAAFKDPAFIAGLFKQALQATMKIFHALFFRGGGAKLFSLFVALLLMNFSQGSK